MSNKPSCCLRLMGMALCFGSLEISLLAQNIPGRLETNSINFHEDLCKRFKAGDTNVPLLKLDSFEGPLKGGSLSREGKIASGWYNGISNPGSWRSLDKTNLVLVIKAIDALPPAHNEPLPLKRQLHISGIRSNQCFHAIYDLNECPKEVGKLLDLFGWPFENPRQNL